MNREIFFASTLMHCWYNFAVVLSSFSSSLWIVNCLRFGNILFQCKLHHGACYKAGSWSYWWPCWEHHFELYKTFVIIICYRQSKIVWVHFSIDKMLSSKKHCLGAFFNRFIEKRAAIFCSCTFNMRCGAVSYAYPQVRNERLIDKRYAWALCISVDVQACGQSSAQGMARINTITQKILHNALHACSDTPASPTWPPSLRHGTGPALPANNWFSPAQTSNFIVSPSELNSTQNGRYMGCTCCKLLPLTREGWNWRRRFFIQQLPSVKIKIKSPPCRSHCRQSNSFTDWLKQALQVLKDNTIHHNSSSAKVEIE